MSVEQHYRYAVPVFVGEPGVVGIYDLEVPALAICTIRHERQSRDTESAGSTGHENNGAHQQNHRCGVVRDSVESGSGIVRRLMRPATVLAIILLLVILTVAGLVFVIQLLSVT